MSQLILESQYILQELERRSFVDRSDLTNQELK